MRSYAYITDVMELFCGALLNYFLKMVDKSFRVGNTEYEGSRYGFQYSAHLNARVRFVVLFIFRRVGVKHRKDIIMDVFYIENEVGEMEKAISGYFSSFDKAYEVLQDTYAYQGQYIGPGKIYQVEVDALRPHPGLVCVYGATVNKDSELYKLTESVFKVLSDSPIVLDEKHLYDGFFQFASNCNHPACWKLNDYFIENNVTPTSPAFQMCFDSLYLQQKEATKEEHAIKFNLNAAVIFGDGFKGKVVAYDPQADM